MLLRLQNLTCAQIDVDEVYTFIPDESVDLVK
jgi:hypothetical protein